MEKKMNENDTSKTLLNKNNNKYDNLVKEYKMTLKARQDDFQQIQLLKEKNKKLQQQCNELKKENKSMALDEQKLRTVTFERDKYKEAYQQQKLELKKLRTESYAKSRGNSVLGELLNKIKTQNE